MEDRTLLSTFDVLNTADSGLGSLRQAILNSNATPGSNTIDFLIPGAGVHIITPATVLPAITSTVLIDGSSQPGFAGLPLIELSGALAGQASGLTITGSDVTIKSLAINGFYAGAGVRISGAGATANAIEGSLIGTDPTGDAAVPNSVGIQIDGGASNNRIGFDGASSAAAAERNIISGNSGTGVLITGAQSDRNIIAGNRIGTDLSGSFVIANVGDGIEIDPGVVGTTIGGTASGAGNVISGNAYDGVWFNGSGATDSVIQGNFVGTNAAGTSALGNGFWGVFFQDAGANTVGGTASGAGNIISGNNQGGVAMRGIQSAGNVVQGNRIGVDATGAGALGNGYSGIYVGDWGVTGDEASGAQIGGTSAGAANVISANGNWGVFINGPGTTGNAVQGNFIGTDSGGTMALGNALGGIEVDNGAVNNTIGGTSAGAGNLITQNGGAGVTVADQTTTGTEIIGNRIFANSGQAIDLGFDGVTANFTSPRTGPNELQNFPVVFTDSLGRLEGWLGGSSPDTTFRVDVFASSTYGALGSGEAEDDLGSLRVTTDSQGQVQFDIPFAPPPGLSIITATATDPTGNTSEISVERRVLLETAAESVQLDHNQAVLLFSALSGLGVSLSDAEAGPFETDGEFDDIRTDRDRESLEYRRTHRLGQRHGLVILSRLVQGFEPGAWFNAVHAASGFPRQRRAEPERPD